MKALVRDSLERIPHKWRVGTSLMTLLYAVDKEFALACNYPKGRGDEFENMMWDIGENANLVPITQATGGTRQDIVCEGAQALYMNRKYYVQFLSHVIDSGTANILDSNIFVHLTCKEIIASI